jgi:hypothetical protein
MIEQSVVSKKGGLLSVIFAIGKDLCLKVASLHGPAEYLKKLYYYLVPVNFAAHGRATDTAKSALIEGWIA